MNDSDYKLDDLDHTIAQLIVEFNDYPLTRTVWSCSGVYWEHQHYLNKKIEPMPYIVFFTSDRDGPNVLYFVEKLIDNTSWNIQEIYKDIGGYRIVVRNEYAAFTHDDDRLQYWQQLRQSFRKLRDAD